MHLLTRFLCLAVLIVLAMDSGIAAPAPVQVPEERPAHPEVGHRVMVLRPPVLDSILDGGKTSLISAKRSRAGFIWLGAEGHVYGGAKLVSSTPLTPEDLKAQQQQEEQLADTSRNFKKPHQLLLEGAQRLPAPVPYWTPESALGWHKYRAEKSELPVESNLSKKRCVDSLPEAPSSQQSLPRSSGLESGAKEDQKLAEVGPGRVSVKLEDDDKPSEAQLTLGESFVAAPVVDGERFPG